MTTAPTTTAGQTIDREGIFRAHPIEQGIKNSDKSDAVAVSIKFQITEELVDGSWVTCREPGPPACDGALAALLDDARARRSALGTPVRSPR